MDRITPCIRWLDRKSTRLNSSHTVIYTLSLHDALPIFDLVILFDEDTPLEMIESLRPDVLVNGSDYTVYQVVRSEEHTSELQSHSDLHSFPTRRSSDLRSGDSVR